MLADITLGEFKPEVAQVIYSDGVGDRARPVNETFSNLGRTIVEGCVMTDTTPNLRIVHLVEAPETVPTLAQWFVEEWAPYYGPDGPGVAEEDLVACCNRDKIPTALVAFDAESNVVGTAALKADSVGSELGQGPWLAAFLVGKHHRGKGVGTALVEAIEREACRLGFQTIYTSTDAAEGIYRRRGWRALNQVSSLRGPITVYKQDLERH